MLCDFYNANTKTCDIDKECFLLCQGEMKSDRCLFCIKDLELYKKVVNEKSVEYIKSQFRKYFRRENLDE